MPVRDIKPLVLRLLGIAMCVVPVTVAILSYFPMWIGEGEGAVICGFTVLLLSLAALPFYRAIKRFLMGASVYTLWLIAFLLFFALSEVADEMTVISFVGFISNLFGAILLKASRRDKTE